MQKISIEQAIEQIINKDPRYPRDAYEFVREALDFTIKQAKKSATSKDRHVNGKELLEGLRQYALQQYGPLAYTVLSYWNIHCGEDIGNLVYNMVSQRILKTTENDSPADFKNAYNFDEAFRRPFEPSFSPSHRSTTPIKLGFTKPS